jgi:hypothetical protein
VPENPLTGNGDPCIKLAPHVLGPAFIPEGEISCTVRPGTFIFAITFTSECSDAEEPPFFGATPRARRACAIAADDGITTNEIIIDGKTYDVSRHRVQSFGRKVRLPDDDLFGVDADRLRFTADGWAPLIAPLKPGHHTVALPRDRRVRRQRRRHRRHRHDAAGGDAPLAADRPAVHRLVGVHEVAVADRHLAQGLLALQALVVVELVERLDLP